MNQKKVNAKKEQTTFKQMERNEVQAYENEAEELERLEADLLKRLQET